MRERNEFWHDIVKAVSSDNEKEVVYLFVEIFLDIRELLQKGKRGIKIVELELTDREKEVLNGLEEH